MIDPVKRVWIVAGLSVLSLTGCATGGTKQAPETDRLAVVVDTDAGLDDAIALMFLASSTDVDLRAVTVSGTGLAHCFPGARNIVGLLELAGRPEVPVACGPETPLGKGDVFHPFPDGWRRVADGRYGGVWPIGAGSLDERSAPKLLVDTVASSETPVTIVTLGPLTNVAAALALDDAFAGGVEQVVAMGGAFDVAGNTANAEPPPLQNVAEWNLYADPSSAGAVLRAGLPLRFVPLDATNGVPIDAYVLRAAAFAPATEGIELLRALLAGLRGMITAGDYYLWDPLAAVLTVQPELGTIERRTVDVVASGPDAGRTIEAVDPAEGMEAELFTTADGRSAEVALLTGLAGRPVPAIAEEPDLVLDPACTTDGVLRAGPGVVQLDADDDARDNRGVAIGTLAPGRGGADIEAFFAAPTEGPPEWFTLAAVLGAVFDAPTTDLLRLESGTYTIVCVRGGPRAPELVGTSTLTVRA